MSPVKTHQTVYAYYKTQVGETATILERTFNFKLYSEREGFTRFASWAATEKVEFFFTCDPVTSDSDPRIINLPPLRS